MSKTPERKGVRRSAERVEPYLNLLHRYAVAISGNNDSGQMLVRRALEFLAKHDDEFDTSREVKLELFATFHRVMKLTLADKAAPQADKLVIRELQGWDNMSQQAMLLNTVESFYVEEVSYILDLSQEVIQSILTNARNARKSTTRVLIVASRGEAETLTGLVMSMGYRVIGPYLRSDYAALGGAASRASLVIANSRNIKSDQEILDAYRSPIIFISDRNVISDGSRIITTLPTSYQELDMRTAIAKALYYPSDEDSLGIEPEEKDEIAFDGNLSAFIGPEISPVDAIVEHGVLQLAPSRSPATKAKLENLEELRIDHFEDVKRLLGTISNLGPGFTARFQALEKLLFDPLTESSALRIANQTAALNHMAEAADEYLGPESAADVKSLISALVVFSKQFEIWEQFHRDALAHPTISDEDRGALAEVSTIIESQPDDVVSPDLKVALDDAVKIASIDIGADAQLALIRSVSNSVRAIGRYLNERATGAGKEFNAAIDKEIGEGLARGVVTILIAASTPLLALAASLPVQFAWLGPILAAIRMAQARR